MSMIRRMSFALPLLLAGCSSLLNVQRTPFTVYSPQYTVPSGQPTGAKVSWQLAVETPSASDTLDTARMAVMPAPGVLEVFPAARWRDAAPALLRSLIVQGFENSGRIVGVGSAVSGLRADYALAIVVRDFQLELGNGAPHAAVRLQAQLLDYASSRVLATASFADESPAGGADAGSAFVAFQASLNKLIPAVVDWTLREGSAHPRGK